MKTILSEFKGTISQKQKFSNRPIFANEIFSLEMLDSFKINILKKITLLLIFLFLIPSIFLFPIIYSLFMRNVYNSIILDISTVAFFLIFIYCFNLSFRIFKELIQLMKMNWKERSDNENLVFRIILETSKPIDNVLPLNLKVGKDFDYFITKETLVKESNKRGNYRYSISNHLFPIVISKDSYVKLNDKSLKFNSSIQFNRSIFEFNIKINTSEILNDVTIKEGDLFRIFLSEPYEPFQWELIGDGVNLRIYLQKSTYINYFSILFFAFIITGLLYLLVSLRIQKSKIVLNWGFSQILISRYGELVGSILSLYSYIFMLFIILLMIFISIFTLTSIFYVHYPFPNLTNRQIIGINEIFIYSSDKLVCGDIEISLSNKLNSVKKKMLTGPNI